MKSSSGIPWSACASSTLLLQRRLLGRDCGKWRTMVRLSAQQLGQAQALTAAAFGIDPATEWRIVADEKESSIIVCVGEDGRAYVPLVEHEAMRRKKALMTQCLMKIAQAMNHMADELEREGSSIFDETQAVPLQDEPPK